MKTEKDKDGKEEINTRGSCKVHVEKLNGVA
jgi:hypothetical protein